MKIVYYSTTGYTKRYAELLANNLKLELVSIENVEKIDHNEEIIFMSSVMANKICKYGKVKNRNLICVIAVGMSAESNKNTESIKVLNKIACKLFYLQGGLDFSKLKGMKKFMLNAVKKSVIKENKPENQELIRVFLNGADFVNEKHLLPIIKYIKEV